jgi:phage tail sheath gpL-like
MASRISLPTEIITSDKTPRTAVAFDKTSGAKQTSDTAREVLLVGQMLSTATVAANTPTMLLREDDGANYFGAGSMLDIACRAAFLANPFVKMSAVSVADAGVKATGTVTFAGTASISTIYRVRIAGVEYAVDVTLGDTATVIGASLAAKVNADKACPVTAANVTGTVTFTAKNGGTVGNGIKLMHSTTNGFDATTAQVTTTATLSGASLAAGTGTASLTTALAAATGKRYHVIAILLDDATAGGAARRAPTAKATPSTTTARSTSRPATPSSRPRRPWRWRRTQRAGSWRASAAPSRGRWPSPPPTPPPTRAKKRRRGR